MIVHTELCWSGGAYFQFQLTLRDGRRFRVAAGGGGHWNRDTAKAARDLLAAETGLPRNRFRFVHH